MLLWTERGNHRQSLFTVRMKERDQGLAGACTHTGILMCVFTYNIVHGGSEPDMKAAWR